MQCPGALAGVNGTNRLIQVTRRRRIDTLAQYLMEQGIQQWRDATHEIPWPKSSEGLATDEACLP